MCDTGPPPHILFFVRIRARLFSVVFMFASFSFQIQEKTQEKDKLKTINSGFWDSLYYDMCSGDKSPSFWRQVLLVFSAAWFEESGCFIVRL